MKIEIKKEIPSIFLIFLSILASIYFYQNFPEKVATHWNFMGQVDGYSSKAVGAFFGPVLLLFMYLMILISPYLDPKKERYSEFEKVYNIFKFVLVLVMFVIYMATGVYNLGYNINIGIIVPVLIGMLMIFIGNYMGKIKNNYFFGIKNPWTLSSETVWNKTHKFGGYAFILLGISIIVAPLMNPELGMITFLAGILLATIGTFVYSYIMFVKEKKNKK